MTPDQFRQHGKQMIDWIADYLEDTEKGPVLSKAKPGEIRAMLASAAPADPEPFESVFRDFENQIMPGITHWQSPNFFAFFPANISYPSILGELLSAGLGVQGMIWATSPACTELETHVLDWLADELALPAKFRSTSTGGGVIQDTASSAVLCALLAARERVTNGEFNRSGVTSGLVCYSSTQAHSSIPKAVRIAGLGDESLRQIDVDVEYRLRPDLLEAAILADKQNGKTPFFVCATVGTTSSNAMDPMREIGAICQRYGIWLHVDAAMSGTAALCPEFRGIQDGLEFADSYCFNPHKWMFVNFDCDAFYVANRTDLLRALSILPEYLRNQATESGAVIDYRDWQIPLGRRFRALKLWFTIRCLGMTEIRRRVREHVALTQEFAAWVMADDQFELCAPVPLNLACFRHRAGDERNQQILQRLNDSGTLYLTHTKLNGNVVLRMSVGQSRTTREHVVRAWNAIKAAAE